MRKLIYLLVIVFINLNSYAQVNATLQQAQNFERQLKEDAALEKYKEVIAADATLLPIMVKCAELSASIGARAKDNVNRKNYYEAALAYAKKAYQLDANSYLANYAMAMACGKMTEVTEENKAIVAYVKDVKEYVEKAIALNPNDPKVNYTLGKWHWEMVTLNWAKKVAVKALYGGLPKGDINTAISYFEKCRKLDMYFVVNYLELAKAYKYDNKPAKAIEICNILVKLPLRTANDALYKEEGKALLQSLL